MTAGHADVHPSDSYKLQISSARAAMATALVTGDASAFADVADRYHRVEDYQQILTWVAATRGWPCDPRGVDGDHGPDTTRALKGFQRTFDQQRGPLAQSGAVDLATWRAFFACYDDAIVHALGDDRASVAAVRQQLAFLDPPSVGCGNFHPTTGPYRSQTNRRVELLFFTAGEEPSLACHAGGGCSPGACEIYDRSKYTRTHVPLPPPRPLKPSGKPYWDIELRSPASPDLALVIAAPEGDEVLRLPHAQAQSLGGARWRFDLSSLAAAASRTLVAALYDGAALLSTPIAFDVALIRRGLDGDDQARRDSVTPYSESGFTADREDEDG